MVFKNLFFHSPFSSIILPPFPTILVFIHEHSTPSHNPPSVSLPCLLALRSCLCESSSDLLEIRGRDEALTSWGKSTCPSYRSALPTVSRQSVLWFTNNVPRGGRLNSAWRAFVCGFRANGIQDWPATVSSATAQSNRSSPLPRLSIIALALLIPPFLLAILS